MVFTEFQQKLPLPKHPVDSRNKMEKNDKKRRGEKRGLTEKACARCESGSEMVTRTGSE